MAVTPNSQEIKDDASLIFFGMRAKFRKIPSHELFFTQTNDSISAQPFSLENLSRLVLPYTLLANID